MMPNYYAAPLDIGLRATALRAALTNANGNRPAGSIIAEAEEFLSFLLGSKLQELSSDPVITEEPRSL